MRFQVKNDGCVLCTYKADPNDTLPTVGFIGEMAILLIDSPSLKVVEYATKAAAVAAGGIYGGEAVEVPAKPVLKIPANRTVPDLARILRGRDVRVVNGGW